MRFNRATSSRYRLEGWQPRTSPRRQRTSVETRQTASRSVLYCIVVHAARAARHRQVASTVGAGNGASHNSVIQEVLLGVKQHGSGQLRAAPDGAAGEPSV